MRGEGERLAVLTLALLVATLASLEALLVAAILTRIGRARLARLAWLVLPSLPITRLLDPRCLVRRQLAARLIRTLPLGTLRTRRVVIVPRHRQTRPSIVVATRLPWMRTATVIP